MADEIVKNNMDEFFKLLFKNEIEWKESMDKLMDLIINDDITA